MKEIKNEEKEEVKKEVKVEKTKRSTKSKVITVFLCISFFCVFSILLFVIFGRDCLPFGNCEKENTPKQEEKKEETSKEVKSIRKEVETKEGKLVSVKETLNGITLEATVKDNWDIETITVNGKNIKNLFTAGINPNTKEQDYDQLLAYGIYGNYVIFEVGYSNKHIKIYDYRDNSMKESIIQDINDEKNTCYFFKEYKTDSTGITLALGEFSMEQCTAVGTPKPATAKVIDGLTYADYHMDYVDGKLSTPKLVKQYN